MTFDEFVARLREPQKSAKGVVAYCPAHEDRVKRSLSAAVNEKRILIKCFSGCTAAQVVGALKLELRDLFLDTPGTIAVRIGPAVPAPVESPRIVATYDYRDEAGVLLYQAVRYEPKDFRPRHPVEGGWRLGLSDTIRRVPYRLYELICTSAITVWWVEGEKDANRLAELGLAASTSQAGAKSWRDDYAAIVAGAGVQEVILTPDHDEPGEQYAHAAARAFLAAGLRVKVVRLPGLTPHQDVSDWLNAGAGRTRVDLEAFAATVPWTLPPEPGVPLGAVSLAVVMDGWLDDTERGYRPTVARTPWHRLNGLLTGGFAPGEFILVGAATSIGKTAFGLEIARSVALDGQGVLVVSREMVNVALARRLMAQTARVSARSLRRGALTDAEWITLHAAWPTLRGLPIWLTDQVRSIEEIQTVMRGFAVTPPIGLLIVDYLQLVKTDEKHRDRRLEVEAVSQGLKTLALHHQIPVLCLSSMSRRKDPKDKKPSIQALRESGELEYDADIIILLHREPDEPRTDCRVAKNRDGATGNFQLTFHPEYVAFDEVTEEVS